MKIVIIEGTDNIGKDTIISNIIKDYETVTLIHCSSPKSKNISDAIEEQKLLFNNQILDIITKKYNTDILIFNRSFIGEYVYGSIYRNRDMLNTMIYINNLEDMLNSYINKNDLIYIQLLSSSIELMKNNEDNKSLSKGDYDKIKKEIELFTEIYDNSHIVNKHLIYVNDGDKFRDLNEIIKEVKNCIK